MLRPSSKCRSVILTVPFQYGPMAQKQEQPPVETPKSLIVDALVARGYTPQQAANILSIAGNLRRRDGNSEAAMRAMKSYVELSPLAARDVVDIMSRWNDVAIGKSNASELTKAEAGAIAAKIRDPTPMSQFASKGLINAGAYAVEGSDEASKYFYGAVEMFAFFYRYLHPGVSFDDAASKIGSLTPKKAH
jgi:hypothetical protein